MRLRETFLMAFEAVRTNKLRSTLTLVGIVAGVASIIAVMTGISVVQSTVEHELSVLGTQTFQVQKWPAGGFGPRDLDWRKIQQRPPISLDDALAIRDKVKSVDLVGAELWRFGSTASFQGEKTEATLSVVGGDPQYAPNNTHLVGLGRNLTDEDVRVRRKVAVIGYALADRLFPFADPIDRTIKVDGRKYTVVGVFEEKKSALGGGYDNYVLLPVSTWVAAYGMRDTDGNRERSVNVTVRALRPELLEEAIEETSAVLRVARGVAPGEEDNFEIFTNDSQIKALNKATAGVKIGAFVIGSIALVVAGIGIMNIMLVSVTERTREIGIRKALGAKRRDVLTQFLLEAILLCNTGGVAGVALGFALGNLVALFAKFPVHVPLDWAVNGLVFCTVVGLTFGLWPAVKASKLAPIEALRWE
jgi:putative ABC transport system permease protein